MGHKQRHKGPAVLPTSDEERHNMWRDDSLASHFDRREEELKRQFDGVSLRHYHTGTGIMCNFHYGCTYVSDGCWEINFKVY